MRSYNTMRNQTFLMKGSKYSQVQIYRNNSLNLRKILAGKHWWARGPSLHQFSLMFRVDRLCQSYVDKNLYFFFQNSRFVKFACKQYWLSLLKTISEFWMWFSSIFPVITLSFKIHWVSGTPCRSYSILCQLCCNLDHFTQK